MIEVDMAQKDMKFRRRDQFACAEDTRPRIEDNSQLGYSSGTMCRVAIRMVAGSSQKCSYHRPASIPLKLQFTACCLSCSIP
jgi:hypothetical protein